MHNKPKLGVFMMWEGLSLCASHTLEPPGYVQPRWERKWLRSEGFPILPASFPNAVCVWNGSLEQVGGPAQPGDGGQAPRRSEENA